MKRKKQLIIPSLLIVGALTACNNNTAMDTNRTASPYNNVTDNNARYNDGYNRVGNYNNARYNDGYNRVGNYNAGSNYRYDNNGNVSNYGNVNNNNNNNTANVGTNRYRTVTYDANLTDKINKAVKNVKGVEKARTIIYGDNVLVAATTNTKKYSVVEKNIKNAVHDYSAGKDVAVIFGEKNYKKLTDISNDMNDGRDMDIDNRIRDSFRDVRNNVRRGVNNIQDSNLDIVPNNR